MNQLEIYFRQYVRNVRKLSEASADKYAQALRTVSQYLRAEGLIETDMYSVVKLSDLYSLRNALMKIPAFVKQNTTGRRMYSAGLNRYIEFAEMRKSSRKSASSVPVDISKMDVVVAKPKRRQRAVYGWNRDRVIVEQVLKADNFTCEINAGHKTFATRRNAEQYLEGHHLIPISKQNMFENSLDVYANIIGLCPNCHRQLHFGRQEDVREILKPIYDIRAPRLANSGLVVSKDEFLALAAG